MTPDWLYSLGHQWFNGMTAQSGTTWVKTHPMWPLKAIAMLTYWPILQSINFCHYECSHSWIPVSHLFRMIHFFRMIPTTAIGMFNGNLHVIHAATFLLGNHTKPLGSTHVDSHILILSFHTTKESPQFHFVITYGVLLSHQKTFIWSNSRARQLLTFLLNNMLSIH